MNVLCIGDVVSPVGCETVRKKLPSLRKIYPLDLVIANGENASKGNGIAPQEAEYLLNSGVDVITLGNHSFRRPEIGPYLEEHPQVLRPVNFPKDAAGNGYYIHDLGFAQIAVISLIGQVYMEPNNSPFEAMDHLLKELSTRLIILDFHAEATGEKGAMAHYLDGRISALFGTHTHVQTADAGVLPKGTGFITDVGMTGPAHSVLGVEPAQAIRRMKSHLPASFSISQNAYRLDCVLFKLDPDTGRCLSATSLQV